MCVRVAEFFKLLTLQAPDRLCHIHTVRSQTSASLRFFSHVVFGADVVQLECVCGAVFFLKHPMRATSQAHGLFNAELATGGLDEMVAILYEFSQFLMMCCDRFLLSLIRFFSPDFLLFSFFHTRYMSNAPQGKLLFRSVHSFFRTCLSMAVCGKRAAMAGDTATEHCVEATSQTTATSWSPNAETR